ncbi:hypothetical protein HOLleu_04362 [Holothuria leucospilota]|uniref:Ig-like domain-containing protein n=1 Tax=Holothuria leucospilota TaxID=206669 RepID=A0A9Q1HKS3_HOLLE|nr:hypothetical protein HOLleu_04362 [Holothuria leucospilota]
MVFRLDLAMKIFAEAVFFTFSLFDLTQKALTLRCQSPQYLKLGEEGILGCPFPLNFTAIVWYDSLIITEAFVTKIERQDTGKLKVSGDGYEGGSYDIFLNGSLRIPSVTIYHDRVFKVVLLDENLIVNSTDVIVVTIAHPNQSTPAIHSCNTESLCFFNAMTTDLLNCTFSGARPAVTLTWYAQVNDQEKEMKARKITTQDRKYTFSSTAMVKIPDKSSLPLQVLTCKASGPALNFKKIYTIALVSYLEEYVNNHGDSMIQINAELNSQLQIPCTEVQKPNAFVWSFERFSKSSVLVLSVQTKTNVMNSLNTTFNISEDGSINFLHVNHNLEGTFTCTYLTPSMSSVNIVRVIVVDNTKENGQDFPTTLVIILIVIIAAISVILLEVGCFKCKHVYRLPIVSTQWKTNKKERKEEGEDEEFLKVQNDDAIAECGIPADDLLVQKDDAIAECRKLADDLLNCSLIVEGNTSMFEDDAIALLRQISEEARKNEKSAKKGLYTGAVVTVFGGAVAVAGACLLPFTLGTSALIIGAGAALGAGGAAVGARYSIDKMVKDKKRLKNAKPSFQNFVMIQKRVSTTTVRLANVYKKINSYKGPKYDTSIKMDKFRALSRKVCAMRKDLHDTVQNKIRDIDKLSQRLSEICSNLLEATEQPEKVGVEELVMDEEQVNEYKFDSLPDVVPELFTYGRANESSTFWDLIQNLYVPSLNSSQLDSAPECEFKQTYNTDYNAAEVQGEVAKLAKIISGVGFFLTAVKEEVDVLFLGKYIDDVKKDKTFTLAQALEDAANMMEKMNKVVKNEYETNCQ